MRNLGLFCLCWALIAEVAVATEVPWDSLWGTQEFRRRSAAVFAHNANESARVRGNKPDATPADFARLVDAGTRVIDNWGKEGISQRTPSFSHLSNDIADPVLASLWQYYMCITAMQILIHDPQFADAPKMHVTAVVGTGLLSMIVSYLMLEYRMQGGDIDYAKALMLDERTMGIALNAMQQRHDVRLSVEQGCQPSMMELTESTLRAVRPPEGE